MLSNLASYLGYSTPTVKSSQPENAPEDMRLRAVEEDEWVLVENNEKEGASGVEKDADDHVDMTRVTLAGSTHPSSLPGPSKEPSRSGSLDVLNALQESWYLTPPPSFTSEGPVHMETSPLENLLIEHPSMSVYERTQRADVPRKMSNSSPPTASTSEDDQTVILMPIKEKMYKLPRNKLNVKLSKKQSSVTPSAAPSVPLETEERSEQKEPKMKNFVKSPRRSINSEFQNLSKKSPRKRPETGSGSEMISKNSTAKDIISEEKCPILSNVQPRRLYSEVLASKPQLPAVQMSSTQITSTPEPEETNLNLEPESGVSETSHETPISTVAEEAAMSIEESTDDDAEKSEDRDRRKVVQVQPDRQHRLHFLNRSAQKVEQRKTCDLMKKNPLIRTNKAREFNFRNKRQRRADMMQRHSGVNNNRKCAKTTLY